MTAPSLSAEQRRIVNEELFVAIDAPNFEERIDLCLKKGADINARNTDGRTLLMVAVWKESPGRLRYLLRKKPDLFIKDSRGRTAFDLNKDTRDQSSRTTMTQLLLSAMPDAQPGDKPSATVSTPEPVQAASDITLAPPMQIKSRKKTSGGPGGGFKL